jgi:hypothetical protein
MAPIILKVRADTEGDFAPFAEIDNGDDLARSWRVCTKVRIQLYQKTFIQQSIKGQGHFGEWITPREPVLETLAPSSVQGRYQVDELGRL